MVWDDTKSNAVDPENPTSDEKIDATEWNNHVTDQKARAYVEYGTDVPTTTPTMVGSIFIDTTNNKFYYAIGTSSYTDWKLIVPDTIQSQDSINFTAGSVSYEDGTLFYNDVCKCLTFYNSNSDVALNIGQENWIEVKNTSGGTITNGKVVYINNASSNLPTIALAKADTYDTSRIIGVATQDIADGGTGFVTTFGIVRDLNTSALSAGNILYLSSSSEGDYTTTIPTGGNYIITVGVVTKIGTTDGEILIMPNPQDFTAENNDITGFPNITDTTLSFVNGTRTFTITKTGASFYYYENGVKYIKSSNEDLVIANTEGIHYIYYDGATLSESVNPSNATLDTLLRTKPLVAMIYWDATNSTNLLFAGERHSCFLPTYVHAYLHFALGAKFLNGLALGDFVIGAGTLDSHAQFSLASGMIADEDLVKSISAIDSTTGTGIYYLSGANAYWRRTTQAGFCVKTTGTGRLAYNQYTGGAWQLTEVTDNNYVLAHIYATNGETNKYISVIGQAEYTSLALAQAGAINEAKSLQLGGLPTKEFVLVGTVIFNTKSTYSNAVKAKIVQTSDRFNYVDWRVTSIAGGGSGGSTDLTAYMTVDGSKTFTGIVSYDSAKTFTSDNQIVTKKYVDDNSGGTGSATIILERKLVGELFTGTMMPININDALATKDIKEVRISTTSLPVGQAIKVDIRKSGVATTNSIFTSDTPIEIGTSQTATNGVYMTGCDISGSTVGTSGTTIDSAQDTLSADDVLYVVITQVGSTTTGTDLVISITVA